MDDVMWKLRKPRCGFLFLECNWFRAVGMGNEAPGGSLAQHVAARTAALAEDLRHDMDVVDPGLVSRREQLVAAMRQLEQAEVDCVFASFTSWTEDFAWVRFLRDFAPQIPVLLWCMQPKTLDLSDNATPDHFVQFLLQTGLVGSLEGSGSAVRLGRRILPICGSLAACRDRLVRFALASKTRSILRQARIGLLQGFNEVMWATYVDWFRLFAEIGPEVTVVPFERLRQAVANVPDAAAEREMARLRTVYREGEGVDETLFRESVRASMGLAVLARELRLDAVALNDVDDCLHETLGLRPGFVAPFFGESGSVVVPEADVGMAALGLALRLLTGKAFLFVEPFFFDENRNTFHAGHAGPNDHTVAEPTDVVILPDAEYARSSFRFAGAPFACFSARLGPATMVHLGQTGTGYKIVYSLVESVPMTTKIRGYASGAFRPCTPVGTFFEQLIRCGVTQHFLVVPGDQRILLRDLAFVCGFDDIEIGV